MNLTFEPVSQNEVTALAQWLSSSTWPFHGKAQISTSDAQKRIEANGISNESLQTFWIATESGERAGVIKIFDLEDYTPLFDIRIHAGFRGQGVGTRGVQWLTEYIFETWSDKGRIEGYTRHDNYAMRKVFEKCGYVMEAYHRKAWPDQNSVYFDTIGYGIIREDFESNTITAIQWNNV